MAVVLASDYSVVVFLFYFIAFANALLGNHGSNPCIGEDFKQNTVGNTPVNNMYAVYTMVNGIDATMHLRNHAAVNGSLLNEIQRTVFG